MANDQKEKNNKPLLYKVEPKEEERVFAQQQPEVKHEQIEEEQTTSNKEEKIEQLKHEFGVYEALAEVEREKAVAIEWTQSYRNQEQVEQLPIQEKTYTRTTESVQETRKQKFVKVERESSSEKVAPKRRRKKKKQESVATIITRLVTAGKKNICEAELFGEKTQFQVVGMRGEVVKIRIGFRIRYIKLSDINQLKVISGE